METLLERLLAIESVSAAAIVRRDGAIISSTIDGEEAEALGAMGAAAFDSAVRYVGQLSADKLRLALFETAARGAGWRSRRQAHRRTQLDLTSLGRIRLRSPTR
jgi:hypothetical protein